MNKEKLLALLRDKKIQNYTYNIFFFLVFSFFIIFAIQPNLSTAFRLQKELQDLRLQNKQSEEKILQIVNYQSLMEEYRDSLPVLDEAIPSSPDLAKIVDDMSKTASDSGIIVKSITVESIAFKGDGKQDNASASTDDTSLHEVSKSGGESGAVSNADTVIPSEETTGGEGQMSGNLEINGDEASNKSKKPELLSFTISIEGSASFPQIVQFLNQIIGQRRLKTFDSVSISSDNIGNVLVINVVVRAYYL